jgi:hypothetical protein
MSNTFSSANMMLTVLSITMSTALKYLTTMQPGENALEIVKPFLGLTFESVPTPWTGPRSVLINRVPTYITLAEQSSSSLSGSNADAVANVGIIGMWFDNPWRRKEAELISDMIRGVYVLRGGNRDDKSVSNTRKSYVGGEPDLFLRDVRGFHDAISQRRSDLGLKGMSSYVGGEPDLFLGDEHEFHDSDMERNINMHTTIEQSRSVSSSVSTVQTDTDSSASDPPLCDEQNNNNDQDDVTDSILSNGRQRNGLAQSDQNEYDHMKSGRYDDGDVQRRSGQSACSSATGVCVDVSFDVNVGSGGSITQHALFHENIITCVRW